MLRKLLPSFLLAKDKTVEPQEVAFKRIYVYTTSFGHVTVTWSRPTFSEPSVCTVVGVPMADTEGTSESSVLADNTQEVLFQPFSFEVNAMHPNQLRGIKKSMVMKTSRKTEALSNACFAWDFSHARCSVPGSVEPGSCYYFAVVLDDEMLLLFGDMLEVAYVVTQVRQRPTAVLTTREDRVKLKGTQYKTSVMFGGAELEITINLTRGMLAVMDVDIDGKTAVSVKSLFKMFRGTVKYDLADGQLIQITWDLHDWFFGNADFNDPDQEAPAPRTQEKHDGIVTFSFIEQGVNTGRKTCPGKYVDAMHMEQDMSWWEMMSEWVSSEEERMFKGETFCFVVYLWKN
ncbi:DUF868 family protein (DUF868) [Rhynchospora pubera]|uniref:DUF868 family protein (DUF868) n=1 Tax=Rhynchospora pubera TaxID=906938 RepID=A0AAV8FLW6_9POAL|nr:DUF868 family protein (DUF868) [Rhynchospora pubera]